MTQEKTQVENIEKILLEAKHPLNLDARHEHMLRRVLLNSNFYHEKNWVRWQKRFGLEIITFRFAAYTVLSGMALAFVFQFSVAGLTGEYTSFERPPLHARIVLEDLYERGQMEYFGESHDGSRIYLLKADDDSTVRLYDRSPYSIQLAQTN